MRSVLITGGTGTLGQAIVKNLLAADTERIVVFSRDECKQQDMRDQISDPKKRLRYFVGDVRDLLRLKRAFDGVDHVIHAAALKQIDAMEFNPIEAIRTNIDGSANVIEAALDCGVSRTVLVSTDKAQAPTSLYGATKLCAERLFLASNIYAGRRNTRFSMVRFGNISFSRGSVIPRWKAILATGSRVVPVTDPECTRYWITAEDCAQYAINALYADVPHMPSMPAYRVKDLAEAMGAAMMITGLRPGERLHEDGSENARLMTVEELKRELAAFDRKAGHQRSESHQGHSDGRLEGHWKAGGVCEEIR